jgi:hypothetical protein
MLGVRILGKGIGVSCSILETLYKQKSGYCDVSESGYVVTENYVPYVGRESSICMKKGI